jgi:hypothetical protein
VWYNWVVTRLVPSGAVPTELMTNHVVSKSDVVSASTEHMVAVIGVAALGAVVMSVGSELYPVMNAW